MFAFSGLLHYAGKRAVDLHTFNLPHIRALAKHSTVEQCRGIVTVKLHLFISFSVSFCVLFSLCPVIGTKLEILKISCIFTARSELCKVLFLELLLFYLCMKYLGSLEPLNGFAPNSQGRRVWSITRTSLNAKVKGRGHHGQKLGKT